MVTLPANICAFAVVLVQAARSFCRWSAEQIIQEGAYVGIFTLADTVNHTPDAGWGGIQLWRRTQDVLPDTGGSGVQDTSQK